MSQQAPELRHFSATAEDFVGNRGIGRYVLLPGSDGRAREMASHFDQLTVKHHPRGHHLYLGTIKHNAQVIDVATIASGMGCPSMEIILHELFRLGAKRFLRVGTAGSLQDDRIKIGDIVNVQGSVRDESTTVDYAPLSIPALASSKMIQVIEEAAIAEKLDQHLHTGIVHCKASLYGREFGAGPRHAENDAYMDLLSRCGVLATEMETATLFIQAQIYNYMLSKKGKGPLSRVLAGALMGILTEPHQNKFASESDEGMLTDRMIKLALRTVKVLAEQELQELT
jgi:uridine phosphorylase